MLRPKACLWLIQHLLAVLSSGILGSVFSLFYPRLCVVCNGELVEGESNICTGCLWEMPLTDFWTHQHNYVIEMMSARLPFEHGSALMFFSRHSQYRLMIHRMKYSARRDIAVMLGRMYGRFLSESPYYQSVDLIVPIPLHWTRRIFRGYNQAEEFARGLSESMGVACDFGSVIRRRITHQQARKDGHQRWANVRGAFAVSRTENLRGKHLLLVDDVLTTGSTIESCGSAIVAAVPDAKLSIATLAVVQREQHSTLRV